MESNHYAYRVSWSHEDEEYVATCTELPGLSWLAKSPTAAMDGIYQAVKETLRDMDLKGETPPQAQADRQYSGKIAIRIPPETHRALVEEARDQKRSMNRVISNFLQQKTGTI